MKPIVCYVQAQDGTPLMPCRSHGRVKRMLKAGKAHIVSKVPFTIRLDYGSGKKTDMVILGQDPGRTNIGLCAIDARGHVLYASDVRTRNKTICKLMLERKKARQASRRGERKRRQRRAVKAGTCAGVAFHETGMGLRPDIDKNGSRLRMLPQCRKPVRLRYIRNSESRFCNRKRPDGWLTPTARQLLQTHENAIKKVMRILPVSCIVLELNRFAFARMDDPDIKKCEYQLGPLHGFDSVEEAVDSQQHGACLLCGKQPIERYHHIVPVSRGGSDRLGNRAGLCTECHNDVHTKPEAFARMQEKKAGLEKKYAALSCLNQAIPHLLGWLLGMIGIRVTSGWKTKQIRDSFGLDKDHYIDAFCIAASVLIGEDMDAPEFGHVYHIVQYRRHDRAIIQRTERRKYKLGGKAVAYGRHKAIVAEPKKDKSGNLAYKDSAPVYKESVQAEDSLEEFRAKMAAQHGAEEAERIVSRLEVVKSKRVYCTKGRYMPGAVFDGPDGRFVMHGQHNNCTRYQNEEFPVAGKNTYREYQKSMCGLVLHNAGLVYLQNA